MAPRFAGANLREEREGPNREELGRFLPIERPAGAVRLFASKKRIRFARFMEPNQVGPAIVEGMRINLVELRTAVPPSRTKVAVEAGRRFQGRACE